MTEELLLDRVKRLQEIDERLEKVSVQLSRLSVANGELEQLRFDLRGWIEQAVDEFNAF